MCVCLRRHKIQKVTCANQEKLIFCFRGGVFYDVDLINLNFPGVSVRPPPLTIFSIRAWVKGSSCSNPLLPPTVVKIECLQTLRGPELLQLQWFKDIYPEDYLKFNVLIWYDEFVEMAFICGITIWFILIRSDRLTGYMYQNTEICPFIFLTSCHYSHRKHDTSIL